MINFYSTFVVIIFCFINNSYGQIIVSDNFENTSTLFSHTGGVYYSGNSASGDRPATTNFAASGTFGIGKSNGTAVLTSSVINTTSCSSVQMSFKLAAFSITSTGNGLDNPDYIRVEISPDGGTTYYNTLEVTGNGNAYWGYASGTATATTGYDGNTTPVIFSPSAGGNRTSDGYSNINITNIPSVTNLRIRITLLNNDNNERWVIDNFSLSGICISCIPPTTTITPTTQTICVNTTGSFTLISSAISPSYTWEASSNGTSGWNPVINNTPIGISYTGSNTAVLSYTSSVANTYFYRCLVAESGTCTATSSTASLTVNNAPTITLNLSSAGTYTSGSVSFSVGTSENGVSYQWQEDSGLGFNTISNGGSNPAYSGATSSVLTISNPTNSMNNYVYRCILIGACGTSTSTSASLFIYQTTTISCIYTGAISIYDKCGSGQGCTAGCDLSTFNTSGYNMCNGTANSGNCTPQVQGIVLAIPSDCELQLIAEFKPRGASCPNSGVDNNDYLKINGTTYTASANATITRTITQIGGNITLEQKADRSEEIRTFTTSIISGVCSECSLLPVQLIKFDCIGAERGFDLRWATASEHNSKKFEIEYSNNGILFTKIATVNAAGESNQIINYNYFIPNNFNSDIIYFRLKMNDMDNSFSYSSIVYLQNDIFSDVYISPNPTLNNNTKIILGPKFEQAKTTIHLFDFTGKSVIEKQIIGIQDEIDVSNLKNGIYLLNIITPYKNKNYKLIIQK